MTARRFLRFVFFVASLLAAWAVVSCGDDSAPSDDKEKLFYEPSDDDEGNDDDSSEGNDDSNASVKDDDVVSDDDNDTLVDDDVTSDDDASPDDDTADDDSTAPDDDDDVTASDDDDNDVTDDDDNMTADDDDSLDDDSVDDDSTSTDDDNDSGDDDATSDDDDTTAPACTIDTDPLTLRYDRGDLFMAQYGGPDSYGGMFAEDCQVDSFTVGGARGQKIEIRYFSGSGVPEMTPVLQLYDAGAVSSRAPAELVAENSAAPGEELYLDVELPYSGEYQLLIYPQDLAGRENYTVQITCLENCDKKFTRFPIVLWHGMGGFVELFGVLNYFYKVAETLENEGYKVYTIGVDPMNDSMRRAEQGSQQIVEFMNDSKARKVNIIAHSQGGIDSRYMISTLQFYDRVGVLMTVATPHRGSFVADAVLGLVPDFAEDTLAGVVDALAPIIGGSNEQDTMEALSRITLGAMDTFNQAVPDRPEVTYWSSGGVSCGPLQFDCQNQNNGEVVDTALLATYKVLDGDQYEGQGPNDGMVMIESTKWGEFLGEIPADHMDEVGQIADEHNQSFNHFEYYKGIAARMFEHGF